MEIVIKSEEKIHPNADLQNLNRQVLIQKQFQKTLKR